jgi:leader peptidase (prepilin peptidase) / N-methyltransferase
LCSARDGRFLLVCLRTHPYGSPMPTLANERDNDQWHPDARGLSIANVVVGLGAITATAVSLHYFSGPTLLFSLLLAGVMLAIARIDFEHLRIPDALSLPSIPLGLLASSPFLELTWPTPSGEHVLGFLVGGLIMWAARLAYWRLRGYHGLGLGDVKLAAAAGSWTGLGALPSVLLLACVIALLGVAIAHALFGRAATATTTIPFGAALAPAIWIVWLSDRLSLL